MSVFNRLGYKPHDGGPTFDEEQSGGHYEITTGNSRAGQPKFIAARRL